ncbi:hypothetical protein [Endozoicomonas sp. ALC020]|uniref:hypothetical protein n=1 Tax=unclassified Endozoicomonas TaxID=2644528 RepID=UPI003BAE3219
MPIVCQPETLTRRFIVELQQDTGFPGQNFSITSARHILPDRRSEIVDTNGYPGSDSQPDDTRHISYGYRVKTTIIETQDTSPPLTRIVHLFAAIFTMFGSEHHAQQYQPSGSSGQQASQTTSLITNSFTLLLNTDYRDGSDYPKGNLHTLGFNCFVHHCHGVCQFRPSSNSRGTAEPLLNSEKNLSGDTELIPGQSSCPHLASGYCFSCLVQTDPLNTADIQQNSPFETLIQLQYNSEPLFKPEVYSIDCVPAKPIDRVASDWIASDSIGEGRAYEIDPVGNTDSVASIDKEDFQQRPCGKVYRNVHTLLDNRSRIRSGQKNCHLTIIGEDGQQRPCGAVCKNARAFWDHKSKAHSKQKICDATILEKNGQLRPCGTVCKNIRAFWDHKYRIHTGQKTCDVTVTAGDGQPRPCGAVCKNSQVLSGHKRNVHGSPKICDVTVVGVNGQPQQCGKTYKSLSALSDHKRKHQKRKLVDVERDNAPGP